jgi:hypothetical protein
MPIEDVRRAAKEPSYRFFDDPPPPDKPHKDPRQIQEPLGLSLKLHYRFARMLDRVVRPVFLHSATKKRSHISNARVHCGDDPVVSTDIEKFYENTTRQHVKGFLYRDLSWPLDLANLMADALTVNGHLPTGSAVSPLLSYFTHHHRFAEVERICAQAGCVLTLFVDDITVSGKRASKSLLYRIKHILMCSDLRTHKERCAAHGSDIVITGAVRDGGTLRLRNKHRKEIVAGLVQLESGDLSIRESLAAKIASARAVDPAGIAPLARRFAEAIAAKR